jgi:hypothetical protein
VLYFALKELQPEFSKRNNKIKNSIQIIKQSFIVFKMPNQHQFKAFGLGMLTYVAVYLIYRAGRLVG